MAAPRDSESPSASTDHSTSTADSSTAAATSIPLPSFLTQSRTEIHNKFIDLEWQQRERLHQGLQTQASDTLSRWARVSGDDVMKRNRYMNVDPFVNNRIRLKVPEGHSDYINASPIKLKEEKSGREKYFIATQGPKEGSHSHIWRMIWHETEDPAVIIMLTQTHESGREKCFQYFPADLEHATFDIDEQDEFEDGFLASLTLLSIREDAATRSTVREMELKTKDGAAKKVWHLLFSGWPDFLVPEGDDRAALLRLIELSAKLNAHADSPRIVHCSAGVGRSGTFISLDWLISELEAGALDNVPEGTDSIAEVVDQLRQQRMMMVQGEQQFGFLYEVVKELWIERWKKRQSEPPGDREQKSASAREVAAPVTTVTAA